MFNKKSRKKYHVSTSRVYIPGRKGFIRNALMMSRPYTKRAVYRSAGALLAI